MVIFRVLLRDWQGKWAAADTRRFVHSILPKVSLRPWFEGQREDRKFVSTMSTIMSGHCTARSHLCRFRNVEGAACIYLKDFETLDHLIWHCERFETERRRLTDTTYCTRCAAWDSCLGPKCGSFMENQKVSVCFLIFLKDAELIICPEVSDGNLFSNKSYRNIDFDANYPRKNTFKNAHFKGLRPFHSGVI
jgi:hypothetical protein